MSDLNDDLLNYDIGDVDDNDLIGAEDEDELLLSDDEDSIPLKISNDQEKELLGDDDLNNDDDQKSPANHLVASTPSVASPPRSTSVHREKAKPEPVDPVKSSPSTRASVRRTASGSTVLPKPSPAVRKSPAKNVVDTTTPQSNISDTSDLVKIHDSSTDELRSQTESEAEPTVGSASLVESVFQTPTTSSIISDGGSEATPTSQSQDTKSSTQTPDDVGFDLEDDSDEMNERTNPKTCIERAIDPPSTSSGSDSGRPHHQSGYNRHQGGPYPNSRGHYPGPYHPYRTPSNENFNPQYPPQFRPPPNHLRPGGRPMHPAAAFGPGGGGPMHQFRMPPAGHPGMPHNQRLPMLPQQRPGQLPPGASRPPFGIYANSGGPMPMRGATPPFNVGGPGAPPHRFPPGPGFPPHARPPSNNNMMMHPGQRMPPQQQPPHAMPANVVGAAPISQPVLPKRKVLINPNFKGGVQAATNQLMKDTMNAQYMAANNEAELLRQQEAFINQNRMHIEKRRRSRDRSRERSVDRDRGRSYSPPNRRRPYDRDNRRPYNGPRDNRGRNETDQRGGQRRSASADRDASNKKPIEDEDEETRAYRLKIEKQKAMREKIIRDKEQRRRKAAEKGKTIDEPPKKSIDEPTTHEKLTPIVVTEKKIISLKKKESTQSSSSAESTSPPPKPIRQLTTGRKIPTATIHPETKTTTATAVVKPVLKRAPPSKLLSDDEFDEDELLADTPPSSPVRMSTKPVAKVVASSSAGLLSNRRIVIRNEAGAKNDASTGGRKLAMKSVKARVGTAAVAANDDINTQPKGIFDRLDKKSIGINSAAKRKIARIVINNRRRARQL